MGFQNVNNSRIVNRLEQDVRRRLDDRGLAHKAFAKSLGMSPSGWSQILTGVRRPSWKLADKLEGALGIPAKRFLKRRIETSKHRAKPRHLPTQKPVRHLDVVRGSDQIGFGGGR